jgi:hypothetical protein
MGETPRLQATPSGGSREARGLRPPRRCPVTEDVPRCSSQVRVVGSSRLQSTHKPSPSGDGISPARIGTLIHLRATCGQIFSSHSLSASEMLPLTRKRVNLNRRILTTGREPEPSRPRRARRHGNRRGATMPPCLRGWRHCDHRRPYGSVARRCRCVARCRAGTALTIHGVSYHGSR